MRLALHERRWLVGFAGIAAVAFAALDPFLFGRVDPGLLAMRAVTVALLASLMLLGDRLSERPLTIVSCSFGILASVVYAFTASRTGGEQSPIMVFLVITPLCYTMILPGNPIASGLQSLANGALMVGVAMRGGAGPATIAYWAAFGVLETAFVALVAAFDLRAEVHLLRAGSAAIAAQRELTDRTREWAQAERLLVLGELSATITHEINNPVSYVGINVTTARRQIDRLIQAGHPELVEVAETLADAGEGVDRIRQIAVDVRGLSHATTEECGPTDLKAALDSAVRLANGRLKHVATLHVELPEGLRPVRANAGKLTQVLLNLLVNAADAVEEGQPQAPAVEVRAEHTGDTLVVTVDDNGTGIPPHVKAKLFTPFLTTKPAGKGTGLGLALCKRYVESFGGTLEAADRPGGGARFVLRLAA
ncbi:MAG TPA: ATP-binding protein [Myxococcales bacterium]|nr:ATP-binding protein [Myxococcales bacterium]